MFLDPRFISQGHLSSTSSFSGLVMPCWFSHSANTIGTHDQLRATAWRQTQPPPSALTSRSPHPFTHHVSCPSFTFITYKLCLVNIPACPPLTTTSSLFSIHITDTSVPLRPPSWPSIIKMAGYNSKHDNTVDNMFIIFPKRLPVYLATLTEIVDSSFSSSERERRKLRRRSTLVSTISFGQLLGLSDRVIKGMSNTSDFVLKKEDHTLGNLLSEHIKMHPNVHMAGYKRT